jgi:hypothetical protein
VPSSSSATPYPVQIHPRLLSAYTTQEFVATEAHKNEEFRIPASELHPLVRGFLKLLGPSKKILVSDLEVLLDDSCHVPEGGYAETDDGNDISSFETMRLKFDPNGTSAETRWMIQGSDREGRSWSRVSALSRCFKSQHRDFVCGLRWRQPG